jgi:acyl-CoA oxidase
MITQQAASFLIKKMTAATTANFTAKDRTDELFAWYLSGSKPYAKIVQRGKISNEAIVTAFRWRAAELVRLDLIAGRQANTVQSHQAFRARVVQKRSWTSLLIQLHRLSDGIAKTQRENSANRKQHTRK